MLVGQILVDFTVIRLGKVNLGASLVCCARHFVLHRADRKKVSSRFVTPVSKDERRIIIEARHNTSIIIFQAQLYGLFAKKCRLSSKSVRML